MTTNTSSERHKVFRVLGLSLGIDEPVASLRKRAYERAGVDPARVRSFRIAHKALDARVRRGRRQLRFVVHVDLLLEGDVSTALEAAIRVGRVVPREPAPAARCAPHPSLRGRRVGIVGAGPAGLFAAWVLSRSGVEVDLIDRGESLALRGRRIAAFDRSRIPDPESNLLYGEGGAGTYSDGKLYTRVRHPLEEPILQELVSCGAPPEICFDARAHIGTDRLHRVLPELRERLESEGVRFHWRTRLDSLEVDARSGRVRALQTGCGELPCAALILAPGHSARDTWEMLLARGVQLAAKPFQLGLRIEHPQSLVDAGRYGHPALAAKLGAAYYNLTAKQQAGVGAAHSFCMCPGGQIVASVNEAGHLCTNGMSNSRHSSPFANSALVSTLNEADFGSGPLAGVLFQRELERAAFAGGGGDYTLPAQRVPDFLSGAASSALGRSSYRLGVAPARLDALLPARVVSSLRAALARFERSLPGFASDAGMLVGVESRSSGPVRIPRDPETRCAEGFQNLYPVGEGAGYAGGIMSAAIDGARSALALLAQGV